METGNPLEESKRGKMGKSHPILSHAMDQSNLVSAVIPPHQDALDQVSFQSYQATASPVINPNACNATNLEVPSVAALGNNSGSSGPSEVSWSTEADHHHHHHVAHRRASNASSTSGRSSATSSPDSTSSSFKKRQCRTLTATGHKRQFVEHNYHDHANADPGSSVAQAINALTMVRGSGAKTKARFPLLLHQMLETAERENLIHILSWQHHGRSFLIRHREQFVQEFLPRFCGHNNYRSFQRQLNLYGFKRLAREGPDCGSYYHELFLRDKVMLSLSIERANVNGKGIRTSSSPETEPNFETMPSVSCESSNLAEYLYGIDLYSSDGEADDS